MFKKKREKLFFVNASQTTIDQHPIRQATKYFPKWMAAEMKKYRVSEDNTQKTTFSRCPGIVDLYRNGLILPTPHQLEIQYEEHGIFWDVPTGGLISGQISLISDSPYYPEPIISDGYYKHAVKFEFGWYAFSTKRDMKILMNEIPYADDKSVRALPGILDLKLNNEINCIAMVRNAGNSLEVPIEYPLMFMTLLNCDLSDVDIEFVNLPFEALIDFKHEDHINRYHDREKHHFYQKLRTTRERHIDRFMKEYLL